MSYGYWDVLKSVGLFAAIRNMLAKRCCPRQGLGWLRSKYLQHPICFRNGSTDLGVFAQIFICLEYACFNQLSDVGLILDLGANVGYSAAYFLSTFKSCFVVCVEPDPDNFNVLLENLKPYEGRYLAIKAAVWPEPTDLWFVPATLGVNNEWGRQVTSSPSAGQPMQTVTIPQIMEMTGRDRISILKVDIEGAEYDLFSRNSAGWISATDNLCVELHTETCRLAFDKAIGEEDFRLSESGELTVARRRTSPRARTAR